MGLIPESGKSPGDENGNLFWYSCLENLMDREAWWAAVLTSPYKVSEMGANFMVYFCVPDSIVGHAQIYHSFFLTMLGIKHQIYIVLEKEIEAWRGYSTLLGGG